MQTIFIYNTLSGKGIKNNKLEKIKKILSQKYDNILYCPTTKSGDAKSITTKYISTTNLIIVMGGDGTINDVASAIAESNYSPVVGIIPNGTMNDLAHTLHIPKNYKKAIDIIDNKHVENRDIIQVNNHYAVYGIAMGRFSNTSFLTRQFWKNKLGKLSYFFTASKDIFYYPILPISIRINGKLIAGKFSTIILTNSDYIAGFKIQKKHNVHTRLILIEEGHNRKHCSINGLFKTIKLFLFGVNNKYVVDKNYVYNDTIVIHNTNNIPIVLDGEKYISDTYNIRILHKKLNLITGKKQNNGYEK